MLSLYLLTSISVKAFSILSDNSGLNQNHALNAWFERPFKGLLPAASQEAPFLFMQRFTVLAYTPFLVLRSAFYCGMEDSVLSHII